MAVDDEVIASLWSTSQTSTSWGVVREKVVSWGTMVAATRDTSCVLVIGERTGRISDECFSIHHLVALLKSPFLSAAKSLRRHAIRGVEVDANISSCDAAFNHYWGLAGACIGDCLCSLRGIHDSHDRLHVGELSKTSRCAGRGTLVLI